MSTSAIIIRSLIKAHTVGGAPRFEVVLFDNNPSNTHAYIAIDGYTNLHVAEAEAQRQMGKEVSELSHKTWGVVWKDSL